MRLLLALLLTLLCLGEAKAQTFTCVSRSADGSCIVPGTGTAPAGTVMGSVSSTGTQFYTLEPTGRFQLRGNNVVTLVPLSAGTKLAFSFNPCAYAYDSLGGYAVVPAAYSPPWDVTTGPIWTTPGGQGLQPQLANTPPPCSVGTGTNPHTVTIGGAATEAAWKTVQVSTDGTTWSPVTLTPIAGTVGSWDLTGGTFTLPTSSNWVYVQFLVATKVATGWAYGGCSAPTLSTSGCQPKWSIQGFFVPLVTINSVSVTPGTFSSAAAVNWPITTMMSDNSSFSGTYYIAGANTCGFGVTASAVTLASMCSPGTYSDWQVVAVPNDPTIPTMSSPGGTATAVGVTIASITPTGNCTASPCSISDTSAVGTVITTFQCAMSDGVSSCPPSGYGWSLTGATREAIDPSTGALTTAIPPPLPDVTDTFDVNVEPVTDYVDGISPTSVFILDTTGSGVLVKHFTCHMHSGAVCSGRAWSISGNPNWLTMTAAGDLYTTSSPPSPLPDGNYSVVVTAQ